MAAVTRSKARYVTPVAYEVNDKGALTEAVTAGDQLIISGYEGGVPKWSKCSTSSAEAHGMAISDGYAGEGGFSVMIQGEMDGFSGMTPGQALYPSTSVAGGLDTTATVWYTVATTPVVNVPAYPRVRAVTPTRIRVNYV
jgi:hypothetical protein